MNIKRTCNQLLLTSASCLISFSLSAAVCEPEESIVFYDTSNEEAFDNNTIVTLSSGLPNELAINYYDHTPAKNTTNDPYQTCVDHTANAQDIALAVIEHAFPLITVTDFNIEFNGDIYYSQFNFEFGTTVIYECSYTYSYFTEAIGGLFIEETDYRLQINGYKEDVNNLPELANRNLGPCVGFCATLSNINPATGNVFNQAVDVASPIPGGELAFSHFYNSQAGTSGRLGNNRTDNFDVGIAYYPESNLAIASREDGKQYFFRQDENTGEWCSLSDITHTLESIEDINGNIVSWDYTNNADVLENYNQDGQLQSFLTKEGFLQQLDYSADGDLTTLDSVTATGGGKQEFTYDSQGRVDSVTSPNGEVYQYAYDLLGNLETITFPDETPGISIDNPKRTYLYEDPNYPNALTGIIDANNERIATYGYDTAGRAITSEAGESSDKLSLSYNEDIDGNLTTTTVVTPDNGATQELFFEVGQGVRKLTDMGSDACVLCGGNVHNTTYDANGFVNSQTDFNGNLTIFENNARGLPECVIDASGQAETRMIRTHWHGDYRVPTEISVYAPDTDAGDSLTPLNCAEAESDWQHLKKTVINYNNKGQVLVSTETDVQTNESRSMSYSYYGESDGVLNGQLKSVNGKRTDVVDITTYEYDLSTANLIKITNALGHETKITQYDGNNRPTRIESPNNLITTLSYFPEGWLKERTVDGQTTQYDYYPDGSLEKITLPNGASLTYTRDAARRITDITDNLGNKIHYILDALGNRIEEEYIDDAAAVIGQLEREYNVLNLLSLGIGGEGQLIRYEYDGNGNLRAATDPRNTGTDRIAAATLDPFTTDNTSISIYDALNRLITSTNIQSVSDTNDDNVVSYKYDALNNLVEVTDPKGLKTAYNYNALGDLKSMNSPDTDTMAYLYDSAGNRSKQTDARGVEVNFTYDALNRLEKIDYTDDTLDITYSYDNPAANGVGRLTGMTDESGTSAYAYDKRGNVESMTTVIDGHSYTTAYQYNGADQPTHIIYPSDRIIEYERDSVGRVINVTSTFNGITENITNNITYAPFGPITGYTYGNGVPMTRPVDKSYRLTELKHDGIYDVSYDAFDAANNILSITNNLDSNLNQTFTYDSLHRLDVANGDYGNQDYDYDANGNRTSLVIDALTTTNYNYPVDSHRLQDIVDTSTRTYTYDANGNTTNNGILGFNYGDHNRLEQVTNGAATVANYAYNGNGERVKKDVNSTLTYFHYDLAGQLISESNNLGDINKEYIFLAGEPIAITDLGITGADTTVVIDNGSCGFVATGDWTTASSTTGFFGTDYLQSDAGVGDKKLVWRCQLEEAGQYTINAQWCAAPTHASNVTYTVEHTTGTDTVTVNQQQNGGQFNLLGSYALDQNSNITLTDAANGIVIGDAIQLIKQGATAESLYFIHGNHNGTPQVITDINQTIVWQAKYDPYGKAAITTASITNNLRFPGQYFDSETNLHYNYFRYYEPETGRYITSDPIGLLGGINTYSYVENNPVSFFDPYGQSLWTKVGKFIYKGGDVTATFAGQIEDTATLLNPAAPLSSRVLAGLSLASELLPISARDVGDGYGTIKNIYEKCKIDNVTKSVEVSRSRFPESAKHIEDAVASGKPNTVTIDRANAASRRRDALRGTDTKPGLDRDEFPPAMFREGGQGSSVRHIDRGDNRGSGACIGAQCRGLSDGTKVIIEVVD